MTVTFHTPEYVHWKRFDSDLVVLNLGNGQYYGLNDVGAEAFERLATGSSRSDVAQALLELYAVDRPTVEADLERLLATCLEQGLLIARSTG